MVGPLLHTDMVKRHERLIPKLARACSDGGCLVWDGPDI